MSELWESARAISGDQPVESGKEPSARRVGGGWSGRGTRLPLLSKGCCTSNPGMGGATYPQGLDDIFPAPAFLFAACLCSSFSLAACNRNCLFSSSAARFPLLVFAKLSKRSTGVWSSPAPPEASAFRLGGGREDLPRFLAVRNSTMASSSLTRGSEMRFCESGRRPETMLRS